MKKIMGVLCLIVILIVGCSDNSWKNKNDATRPTLNEIKDEQVAKSRDSYIFESEEDIKNNIKSKVLINTYYEEPASLKDRQTIILKGITEGEFVEVVVTGEIKDFKHVEVKWDEQQNELKETRIINALDKLTNKTIVIKTYLPDGIPSEKIEWKTISGKPYEIVFAQSGIGAGVSEKEEDSANEGDSVTEKNPTIPQTGKDLESFIPVGWNIKSSVEGNLNKDSLPDIAAVIEKKDDPDSTFPRILLILVQEKDKSYTLAVETSKAIMRADEGGVWGDPLESIAIDKGTILLSFYGGSNSRWYNLYRFRYQDNGWYLIGATLGSYFTGTTTRENADEEDYNLLTGDYIIKKADENGKVNTTKGNRGKKPLLNLNEFIVDSAEKQF